MPTLVLTLAAAIPTPAATAAPAAARARPDGQPRSDGPRPAVASCPAPTRSPATTASRQAPAPRPLRTATLQVEGAYSAPDAPRRMIPSDEYPIQVTVRNTTAGTLPKSTYALSYRWFTPDGRDRTTGSNRLETALPTDLAPGASVLVEAKVKAPSESLLGQDRERYVLAWDLRNRDRRTWLSETADVAPLRQDVTVEHPTSNQLGLENFYQYAGTATGAGSGLSVNAFSGNAVLDYTPIANPSRGPVTFVRLAYNSQDGSTSSLGSGWSLATSTLTRLGSPLEFQGLLGDPERVTLVDGDGTGHHFALNRHDSLDRAKWTYDSPAGVHLLLQRTGDDDDARRWSMTGPDRTRMYFDERGYQTATVDRNGNELTFEYAQATVGNRHTGVLTGLVDATGRRTLTLDYYQRGDDYAYFVGTVKRLARNLTNADIEHQLRSITDVSGRTLTFTYNEGGELQEIVDGAGTPQARAFGFHYDDGRLVRAVDPNGNHTDIAYHDSGAGSLLRGRVAELTDRRGHGTDFGYADADGADGSKLTATVTDANGHPTHFLLDGYGRVERLTNAKGEVTQLVWDADNNVVRLREHNGALATWVYDQKTGYPLEIRDAEANAHDHPPTRLGYRFALDGHVADLTEKTSPEGRRWQFVYDDRGNLVAVTDPKGTASAADGDYTSRYVYDEFGHLVTTTDANGNPTTYADYDVNGYPRRITDALGCSSFFSYDATGNVLSTVDARQKTRTFTYDILNRPLTTRIPKDAAAGEYIVTPGPKYDANDNMITLTAANRAVTTAAYDENDQLVALTAPRESAGEPAKTSTLRYDPVGNLLAETRPKGR
ncbi:DUF6531 domain-containing protein [Plantactinospora solaniradicis]|uniref:DUF6531 domain-containing protein n=1 Tax=Plantactinospora solaniradicis TaxID=1723736 RepID=A0ABW1K2R3_9ACTN